MGIDSILFSYLILGLVRSKKCLIDSFLITVGSLSDIKFTSEDRILAVSAEDLGTALVVEQGDALGISYNSFVYSSKYMKFCLY